MVERGFIHKAKHNRVVENLWFVINELVDSTQYCSTERGATRITFRHRIAPNVL
jgi:heme oxygenase